MSDDQLDWNDLRDDQAPDDPWAEPEPARERPPLPEPTPHGDPAAHAEAEPVPNDGSLRSRVLAHPELAKRLCDPPLSYSRPEVWTGYVPAETWQGHKNTSTRRTQLLGIIAELEGLEAQKEAAE